MIVAAPFQVGWRYGSTTEDVHTGLMIQKRGWRSALCTPNPPAFLGCAPSGGPTTVTQQKRWATGLLEVLFSKSCPIFATIFGELQFRQCLAYTWILSWGLRSILELCYAALPAYCIITNTYFLPKVSANHNPPILLSDKHFNNSLICVFCIIMFISSYVWFGMLLKYVKNRIFIFLFKRDYFGRTKLKIYINL